MDIKDVVKYDQAYVAKSSYTWDEWHKIFGHLNMGSIKMLKDKDMVDGMDVDKFVEPQLQY